MLINKFKSLALTGFSFHTYYENLNLALTRLNNEPTMLHYPYYVNPNDGFLQSQKNLTDFCLRKLGTLTDKSILEIGCGNGIQASYIMQKYKPSHITGIDLNPGNLKIAEENKQKLGLKNIQFMVDDSQVLKNIKDKTFDIVINIESAFHYPDKPAFFKEIRRVLKPGGQFLIADILNRKKRNHRYNRKWRKKMILYHWIQEEYEAELPASKLKVTHTEDITQNIIKGFKNYPAWLNKIRKKQVVEDFLFRLFYLINVKILIGLQQRKRRYMVFVGEKM